MFSSRQLVIDAFIDRLREEYLRAYGRQDPDIPGILAWAGSMALENLAGSDALYHDMEHTLHVTLVGQEILKGKHIRRGGVNTRDWLHTVLALLCHDIGYVRGVCRGDREGVYVTGTGEGAVEIGPEATDVALTPWHVDRGRVFVRERFGSHPLIDADRVADCIERTRFPAPDDPSHAPTDDYPGLVRAADLIGQLGDPDYLRKLPALYYEFEELGTNERFGYRTPGDLRRAFAAFYWQQVRPYVESAFEHLRVTRAGRQWIANLHAHVFASEHQLEEKGVGTSD